MEKSISLTKCSKTSGDSRPAFQQKPAVAGDGDLPTQTGKLLHQLVENCLFVGHNPIILPAGRKRLAGLDFLLLGTVSAGGSALTEAGDLPSRLRSSFTTPSTMAVGSRQPGMYAETGITVSIPPSTL